MLTTLIQNTVHAAGQKLSDIDAFAVAKGPGSYTGLRIGVSTIKGLCYTLEKPMIAINSLEAMAVQLKDFFGVDTFLCPMIDARRMEVYCAVYQAVTLKEIEETQAKIIDETSFTDLLSQNKMIFFGDGADKCKATFEGNPNAIFLETPINPSARTVGQLAAQAFINKQFEDVADFEPFYLKDFMATTPRSSMLKGQV